jgi:hypothetical protein
VGVDERREAVMTRRLSVVVIVTLFSVAVVPGTASAAPPVAGAVIEGAAVPGAAIGITRAGLESAWGAPSSCQSVEVGGDLASCTWNTSAGSASARLVGADGGNAQASPSDVVHGYRWSGYPDWVTGAGVGTSLVLSDFDAAAAAYPGSTVVRGTFGGTITNVEVGVTMSFSTNPYSGITTASMAIFPASGSEPEPDPEPEPQPDPTLRVGDLALTRSGSTLRAAVSVVDQHGDPVPVATVAVTWTRPWGGLVTRSGETGASGEVVFTLRARTRGIYRVTVDDVSAAGYVFDDSGVLTGTIRR